MKNIYYYLTATSILVIVLAFSLIRIPVGDAKKYELKADLEGAYRHFNLKEHIKNYDSLRILMANEQHHLGQVYQETQAEQKEQVVQLTQSYLLNSINEQILPFWLDTEWDYNGITEVPRQGTIACGYFVTTVLQHAGIRLNRYYLSRQASSELIRALCPRDRIKRIIDNDFDALMEYLESQGDGIYIIGLDKHVGMALKVGEQIDFVHSRKPRYVGVIREKASESSTLKHSSVYVIGSLLENKALIQQWLSKKI